MANHQSRLALESQHIDTVHKKFETDLLFSPEKGLSTAQREEKTRLLTSIYVKWNEDLLNVPDSPLAVFFKGRTTAPIPIDVLRKLAALAENLPISQKDAVIGQLNQIWHSKVERPPKGERKKLTASDIKQLVDSLLQEKRQQPRTPLPPLPVPNILPSWSGPTPPAAIAPSTSSTPPSGPGSQPGAGGPPAPFLRLSESSMRNINLPLLSESLANLSADLNAGRDRQASTISAFPTQLSSHKSPFQLAQPSFGNGGGSRQTIESPFRLVEPSVGNSGPPRQRTESPLHLLQPSFGSGDLRQATESPFRLAQPSVGGNQQASQTATQPRPAQSSTATTIPTQYAAQNQAHQAIAPLQQQLQDQGQEITSLRQQLEDVKKDRDEVLAQRVQIQDALDRFLNRRHPTYSPISDQGSSNT